MRLAVIGGGAWGTTLAHVAARRVGDVSLWAREPDVVQSINRAHVNARFLAGVPLHEGVRATDQVLDAVRDREAIVFAAPSHVLRDVVRAAATCVPASATVVVATKGIERGTLALMSDVAAQELPGRKVVALSGPSFALEVARNQPTALVAASRDADAAAAMQQVFSAATLRVYTNDDVAGVELGGALKNVMAIATGIADGLELGLNSRAALITRGLAEMTRLGVALGARAETFAGLAGLGDLVLTCTGALSRNRTLGVEIGRGRTLAEVLAERETVAEGVVTTESTCDLATREGIEMPIVQAVARVLFSGLDPRAAITSLMSRDLRSERDE
ncbi:MAG TPA: NAD(P)H-dependent glycerol-3-phosphate dehydrogenase [Gemmatimonadaceae bacterium]|nr:NAD(P)H-dependent glycerol-3-phosphate dehydrogenase [Gemmatimonadaceae bacterium]